jgi:hypothetical protein
MLRASAWLASASLLLLTASAHAQGESSSEKPWPTQHAEASAPAEQSEKRSDAAAEKPTAKLTPIGYIEAHYAYNFNRPSNGITNFRGFDNRHDTFSLTNLAFGSNLDYGPVNAKLILQIGATPSTYYLGEPSFAGTGVVNASGPELWKYIQEAHVGYKAPVGRGLLLELGLFAAPCGYEVLPVKDNWNWSRSNLFFGFPYYHTGLRATYEWSSEVTSTLWVVNGWNSVVDNNEEKSLMFSTQYKVMPDQFVVTGLYMGGIERATGSPEGPYWRHQFDLTAQYDATTWLSFAFQGDYGWEPSRIATARWVAGALYTRAKPFDGVYLALRGDRFHEHVGTANGAATTPIFWGGVEWVSSATATLDVRPIDDHLSIRLEYRHDASDEPLYFGRDVPGNGSAATPFLPNARTQDTLLFGATAWF